MTKYIFPAAATLISLLLVFEPHKIVRAAFWPGLVIAIWFSWRESREQARGGKVSVLLQPWTQQQCDKLNEYQHSDQFHPYTCGNDSRHHVLVATPQGWACPDCDYRQGWAHESSLTILDAVCAN